jgi:hypothetical protein
VGAEEHKQQDIEVYMVIIVIKREKMQILSLAKQGYSVKVKLFINATLVGDPIRVVFDIHKDQE